MPFHSPMPVRLHPPRVRDACTRPARFHVRAERDGLMLVLQLFGELDMSGCGVLLERIDRARQSPARRVVVDLSGLQFIDCTGAHTLGRAARESPEGRILLLRGPDPVHRVFRMTGLDEQLPFLD